MDTVVTDTSKLTATKGNLHISQTLYHKYLFFSLRPRVNASTKFLLCYYHNNLKNVLLVVHGATYIKYIT